MMDLSGHEDDMSIPIANAYIGGGTHGHSNSSIHGSPSLHRYHRDRHQPSNGPPPPSPVLAVASAAAEDHHHCSAQKGAIKYRECLKNHAASIGGNATDGCGEFMPSSEEGTLEALKCSACGCHRNFHRKETEGEEQPSPLDYLHPLSLRGRKVVGHKGSHLLLPGPDHYHQLLRRVSPHSMIMPLQQQTSESEEVEVIRPTLVKKRFRTKFTAEQKEKMLRFAEKAGWRLQKQEESVVQQFCQEIGVKRRVLKVWMHNNKHNLAKEHAPPHLSSLNDHH